MNEISLSISPVDERATPSRERWKECPVDDRAVFFAAHPECVISAERLSSLESRISAEARHRFFGHAFSSDDLEDVKADIRLRLFELATSYRDTDPMTGDPIYDYLFQTDSYIVSHSALRASSEIRRENRRKGREISLEIDLDGDGEFDAIRSAVEMTQGEDDISDDIADSLSYTEIRASIVAKLSPAETRVFEMLETDRARGEVAIDLGIKRQTVHLHMNKIREVTRRALIDHGHDSRDLEARKTIRRPIRRRAAR